MAENKHRRLGQTYGNDLDKQRDKGVQLVSPLFYLSPPNPLFFFIETLI